MAVRDAAGFQRAQAAGKRKFHEDRKLRCSLLRSCLGRLIAIRPGTEHHRCLIPPAPRTALIK